MSTKLDANQVLKRSFDDATDRIKVDAQVTATIGTVEVAIDAANDSIRLGDGTDLANVTSAGELNVLSTAQPGTDIGDVTVNNGSGASAVNIQDGGNSITVDGSVIANPTVSTTATITSVTVTNASTTILVSNSNRKRFSIYNDSGAIIYVAMAATASTTSFTFQLTNNSFYDSSGGVIYTGIITAIRGSGNGPVKITEYT